MPVEYAEFVVNGQKNPEKPDEVFGLNLSIFFAKIDRYFSKSPNFCTKFEP